MIKRLLLIFLLIIVATGCLYFFHSTHKLQYTGAMSYFEVTSGTQSFKNYASKLDLLSLFWYGLNSDGSISLNDSIDSSKEKDIIQFAHTHNKKVLLGILNYGNADNVENLLDDTDIRKQSIDDIINTIKQKNYDGIVIDYENLGDDDESAFTSYISDLSKAVHAQGKSVSLSTIVQTSGKVFSSINIVAVSKLVDRIELQTYGEHGDDATTPGPLASVDWVDTIIRNAINQGVAPNKIVLGTVDAGHDWIVSPDTSSFNVTTSNEMLSYLKQKNTALQWNDTYKEYTASYSDSDNKKHVVWLEDARSFQAKQDLANKYGLQGIFIWFLGGEDPQMWKNL